MFEFLENDGEYVWFNVIGNSLHAIVHDVVNGKLLREHLYISKYGIRIHIRLLNKYGFMFREGKYHLCIGYTLTMPTCTLDSADSADSTDSTDSINSTDNTEQYIPYISCYWDEYETMPFIAMPDITTTSNDWKAVFGDRFNIKDIPEIIPYTQPPNEHQIYHESQILQQEEEKKLNEYLDDQYRAEFPEEFAHSTITHNTNQEIINSYYEDEESDYSDYYEPWCKW